MKSDTNAIEPCGHRVYALLSSWQLVAFDRFGPFIPGECQECGGQLKVRYWTFGLGVYTPPPAWPVYAPIDGRPN